MKTRLTQTNLLAELDALDQRLQIQNLKDKCRVKKNILRALSKPKFKKPYVAKWWKDYKNQELAPITKNGVFSCPKCKATSTKSTLQHVWHPTPFRVLCTKEVDDREFVSLIPKYIELQKSKKCLNEDDYKRWCRWERKSSPSWGDEEIKAYGRSKTRSYSALGYFSRDKLLSHHIGEIKRYISLDRKDYKYVCSGCAFKEDEDVIKTGRLVRDIPYFLFDEKCERRDVLAQALIEELVKSL